MKRAIALCGGGSRGSYELGVWRSMRENGISAEIIAGTSIGSLNGALMVQDDFELAEKLWNELTIDNVMVDGINLDTSIEAMLNQKDNLAPFLKKYMKYNGADISPLRNLLEGVINEEKLRASTIKFGLVTVHFPSLKPAELTMEEIPQGELLPYLLASSACYPAFPMQKIDGKTYVDGGYYDNLPINFAIRMGGEEVIAVDLSFGATHKEYQNRPCVTYIKPSWDLGSILLFDPKVMKRNQQLGYNDGQRAFGACIGYRFTFLQNHPERKYKRKAEKFAVAISRLEARMLGDIHGPFQKQTALQLTANLTEHTGYEPLDYFGSLLRSLEICGEILGVDHLPIYDFTAFAGTLSTNLHIENIAVDEYLLRLRKMNISPEVMASMKLVDRKDLLRATYRMLKNSKNREEDMLWCAETMPRILTAALGMYILSSR